MSFHGANLEQLRDSRSWDPREGWSIDRPWRGSPAAIDVKIAALVAAGIRLTHEADDQAGYERVTAHLGAEDTQDDEVELTDQWTLVGNDIEKDLWLHPKVTAIFAAFLDGSGFPTSQYAELKQDFQDVISGDKALDDLAWWAGASTDTKKFMRALLRGEESYTVSQFVLRNVKVVAANYSLKPSYSRVGKVMSGTTLDTVYTPPATIKFNLPDGFWMERTPTVEQVAPDKYSITREWWNFDEYDDFIYELVTS